MPYNLIIQDDFIRSTTSVGSGAYSTTGIGVPTVHNSPAGATAWEDITGNQWYISVSGRAQKTISGTNVPYNGIIRPHGSAEDMADGRIRIWSTFQNAGDNNVGAVVRFDTSSGGNGYAPLVYATQFFLFQTVNGATATQVAGSGTVTHNLPAGTDGVLEIVVSGTSLTMNMYAATDTTFSTVLGTQTYTGLTKTTAGAWGICSYDPGHATKVTIESFSSVTPSFVVSPTSATASTPLTVTATGTNTSWVSGTTTFSVTGGTGAGISGLSINNSTQVATFTLNPGSAAGTLTIHNSTDSATATVTVSSAALTGGTATLTLRGKTMADFKGVAPTGGSGSYTYKWQKSTDGTTFTDIASQTAIASGTVTGLTASTQYWIRCYQNDGTNTVYTNVLNFTTLGTTDVVMIAIGDSITEGTNGVASPPTNAVQQMSIQINAASHNFAVSNQGHSGSLTSDWAVGGGYLNAAITEIARVGATAVQIMLGTNDAGASVSDTTFNTNLSAIVTELLNGHGIAKVILHYQPYRHDSGFAAKDAFLVQYQAKIDALVNGSTIRAGDKTAYTYFSNNLGEIYSDGVHMNDTGNISLGNMWATANLNALYGVVTSVTEVDVVPNVKRVLGGSVTSFGAAVYGTGSPSTAVTWTANLGSINASTGVYTAPSSTGSRQTATITATSTFDASKSGTATVTIMATGETLGGSTGGALGFAIGALMGGNPPK